MQVAKYSEKSFVVRGDTKPHKDKLKELGGKYNGNLKDGPGWIFSNNAKSKVEEFVGSVQSDCHESESKVEKSQMEQSNLMASIRNAMSEMSSEERLTFIARITSLTQSLPVSSAKVAKKSSPVKAPSVKKVSPVKVPVKNSKRDSDDSDSSSEDE